MAIVAVVTVISNALQNLAEPALQRHSRAIRTNSPYENYTGPDCSIAMQPDF